MSDIQIVIEADTPYIVQVQEVNPVISPVNGVNALDQLTDVNIPSPTEGQALIYSGGKWRATSFNATDSSYEHNQAVASDTWVITHNLNKYPSVTIVDSSFDEVEGNVNHISRNQLSVSFSAAFSGKAFLN